MYERMLNKEEKPSIEILNCYCGVMTDAFESLHCFLSEAYKTTQEIRFPYGKEYGWCISHRKGKKLICDVFAEVNAFTVMVRLSNQQIQNVYEQVEPHTQILLDNKYPCNDGGWIHFRILNAEHLNDVKKLLSMKCTYAKTKSEK